jgi:hypothetical protein
MVSGAALFRNTLAFCPTHKTGEGGHTVTVGNSSRRHHSPPRLDGEMCIPLMHSNSQKPNPILDHPPKPLGVATTSKEMCRRFLCLLDKGHNCSNFSSPNDPPSKYYFELTTKQRTWFLAGAKPSEPSCSFVRVDQKNVHYKSRSWSILHSP